jgi:hypothetical protein
MQAAGPARRRLRVDLHPAELHQHVRRDQSLNIKPTVVTTGLCFGTPMIDHLKDVGDAATTPTGGTGGYGYSYSFRRRRRA